MLSMTWIAVGNFDHNIKYWFIIVMIFCDKNYLCDIILKYWPSEFCDNSKKTQNLICRVFQNSLWAKVTLLWRHNMRHNGRHQKPDDCLFNLSFRRRSKKTSNLRVTGLCVGNSPHKKASNMENIFIWWRQHDMGVCILVCFFTFYFFKTSHPRDAVV